MKKTFISITVVSVERETAKALYINWIHPFNQRRRGGWIPRSQIKTITDDLYLITSWAFDNLRN